MYDPFWLFCVCVLGEGVGGVEWIFHKPFMTWSFPKIMFSATRPAMKKSRRASTSFLSMFCTSGCRSDSSLVYRQRERKMTSERYVVKEKYCLREILHQRNIVWEKYCLRLNVGTTHQAYVFAPHQYGGFVERRTILGVVCHQSVRCFPHRDHVNRLLVQLGRLQLTCTAGGVYVTMETFKLLQFVVQIHTQNWTHLLHYIFLWQFLKLMVEI